MMVILMMAVMSMTKLVRMVMGLRQSSKVQFLVPHIWSSRESHNVSPTLVQKSRFKPAEKSGVKLSWETQCKSYTAAEAPEK